MLVEPELHDIASPNRVIAVFQMLRDFSRNPGAAEISLATSYA